MTAVRYAAHVDTTTLKRSSEPMILRILSALVTLIWRR